MTTYVFFIGGTGARVLRSLTMLLASGVSIGANNAIVPIILDYDSDNGDLELSTSLLRNYNKMHNTYADYNQNEEGFFCAPIEVIEKLSKVDLKVKDNKKTFAQYIEYDAIEDDFVKKFLRTLYDNSIKDGEENPCAELYLNLEKGFKGNPNIGSVVFNDYFKTNEYKTFEKGFNNQDRVFIVGSIFGGTGSSGLPQLVKWFRQSSSKQNLNDAPIGACVVLPYFKVETDDNSAINSDTFNSICQFD